MTIIYLQLVSFISSIGLTITRIMLDLHWTGSGLWRILVDLDWIRV